MRTVVIYPGRFHPFHRGHKASYDYLVRQFGANNVYVVTSNKQDPSTSPFSYDDKVQMMTKLGVPAGKIAQVVNPYQAQEILDNVPDPENTRVIFAVSEKDMTGPEARFKFGVKKNGEPTKMQPMPDDPKKMQTMDHHTYVMVTPTVNFKVKGADANSASQIRKLYTAGNDADRDQIIADLYGEVDSTLRDIFDKKLSVAPLPKSVMEHQSPLEKHRAWAQSPASDSPTAKFTYQGFTIQFHPDRVEIYHGGDLVYSKPGNYANPTKQQLSTVRGRIPALVAKLKQMTENVPQDYLEEKWSERYKRSINCANPKGFSQRAHCAGRKK